MGRFKLQKCAHSDRAQYLEGEGFDYKARLSMKDWGIDWKQWTGKYTYKYLIADADKELYVSQPIGLKFKTGFMNWQSIGERKVFSKPIPEAYLTNGREITQKVHLEKDGIWPRTGSSGGTTSSAASTPT